MNTRRLEGTVVMGRVACLIAVALAGGAISSGYGQDEEARSSIQQKLSSEFALTVISGDRNSVITPGTLLLLKKDNLLMYSSACPSSPESGYKNGKLSQNVGTSFLHDLGGTMAMPGNTTTASCPQRPFGRGTKLWVTKIDVKKDGIVLKLFTTPVGEGPYYGSLKFSFRKGSVPTPDEAATTISEVLMALRADNSPNRPEVRQTPSDGSGGRQPAIYGVYFMERTGSTLHLNPDGSFSMHAKTGQESPGHFTVNGDTLALTYVATGRSSLFKIQGDRLIADTGLAWVRQSAAPPEKEAPQLRFPASFVSAQNSADRLLLNTDGSFSLMEGGQLFSGRYSVSGATLKLNISELQKDADITIDGNQLVVNGNETWIQSK